MSAIKSPASQPGKVGKPGSNRRKSNLTAPRSHSQEVDVFALAKQTYTIPDLWRMLGLPGEPKVGMNCSPLREERRPSFSIYDGGRKFKDHGGDGAQGDLIAFVQAATDWNHAEIRDYFIERLGIDRGSGGNNCPHLQERSGPHNGDHLSARSSKPIAWPSELVKGSEEAWEAFARLRGYSYPAVWTMTEAGILRFSVISGDKCIVITDNERRAAEIRRVDGGLFSSGSKAYPLKGVDKSWLVGAALLADGADVLITEGATDLLTALNLYVEHRKAGGKRIWCPMALLGSKCKRLDPGLLEQIKGRHVRLVPDGDDDGDRMRDTWTAMLTNAGCPVDVIRTPRGKDLSDVMAEIEPAEVFA